MDRFAKDASTRVEAAAMSEFGIDTLVNIVPRNPIRAAAETDMLGVIFFGLMFGAALTVIPAGKAKPMIGWLEALQRCGDRHHSFRDAASHRLASRR